MKNYIFVAFVFFLANFAFGQRVDTIGDFLIHFTPSNAAPNKVLVYDKTQQDPEKRWYSQIIQGTPVTINGSDRSVVLVTNSDR